MSLYLTHATEGNRLAEIQPVKSRHGISKRISAPKSLAMLLWCGAVVSSLPIAAAPARKPVKATESFAQNIVALAKQERSNDPRALTRLTGIMLRNPAKWEDQPVGTIRDARWRNLRNSIGVTAVMLHDTPVNEAREISSSADLELRGTPCLTIRQIERAARAKATYGGMVIPIVYHGPPEPPYKLGREYATLRIAGASGGSTAIAMQANKPGPKGCLQGISLQVTRHSPNRAN